MVWFKFYMICHLKIWNGLSAREILCIKRWQRVVNQTLEVASLDSSSHSLWNRLEPSKTYFRVILFCTYKTMCACLLLWDVQSCHNQIWNVCDAKACTKHVQPPLLCLNGLLSGYCRGMTWPESQKDRLPLGNQVLSCLRLLVQPSGDIGCVTYRGPRKAHKSVIAYYPASECRRGDKTLRSTSILFDLIQYKEICANLHQFITPRFEICT